uniref:Protein kinase domain-containing protein n=1 Tax=Leptocylindrus danicus TaxID=163516 RepID=A0A7S2P0D5_9STRA|mmetsp:Transcript_19933/g.29668  ORF Transcript_19933/g.29668 Transcript_19933/m.29668 type:complete len:498 (+) Transcript_19933:426-1919(+)
MNMNNKAPVLEPLPFPEAMMLLCSKREIFATNADPNSDVGNSNVVSTVETRRRAGGAAYYRDVLVPDVDARGNPDMLPARATLRPDGIRSSKSANNIQPQARMDGVICGTEIADAVLAAAAAGQGGIVRAAIAPRDEGYEYRSLKANAGEHGLIDVINKDRPVFQGRVMLPPSQSSSSSLSMADRINGDWTATQHYVAIKCVAQSTVEKQIGNAEDTLREVEALQYLAMLPDDEYKNYVLPQRSLMYSNSGRSKDERYLYNVLEFANNRDIFAALEAEIDIGNLYIEEGKARRYAREMLLGLRYLHCTAGVCHRDMKIENVMLHRDDMKSPLKCKIIDFGACLRVPHILDASGQRSNARMNHTGGGTSGYRCPQVTRSSRYKFFDGFKADVWSLGIILVRMMTPFDNDRWSFLERKAHSRNFQHYLFEFLSCSNSELSIDAKKFICSLLTPSETIRPTVEQALNDPWMQFNNVRAQEGEDEGDLPIVLNEVFRAAFG